MKITLDLTYHRKIIDTRQFDVYPGPPAGHSITISLNAILNRYVRDEVRKALIIANKQNKLAKPKPPK